MKTVLSFLLAILTLPAVAQMNVVTIDAYVLDGSTQRPIEFVNINVLDRDLGTVTTADGKFRLEIIEDQVGPQDQIKLVALGYAPKTMSMERLYNLMEKNNVLYLNPYNEVISQETIKATNQGSRAKGVAGVVLAEGVPVQGATIRVKGSYKQVKTDADGKFQIDALSGDVLQVDYLTTLPKEVSAQSSMNIDLTVDGQLLEQVTLKSEKREFLSDRNIETAYGKKKFDRLGYRAAQITADEISEGALTFEQALLRLPTVGVVNPTSINLSNGRAIVIDDMVYGPDQIGPLGVNGLVDINNVYSITVIPGIVGSVRYGTLGRNGVIIIRTKTYASAQGDYKPGEKEETALVTGNNYNQSLVMLEDLPVSDYVARLRQANSFEAAKSIYNQQRSLASGSAYGIDFFVEASEYFEKWNMEYAAQVAQEILNIAPKNDKALKTLAYRLEDMGDLEGAKAAYQRLALLNPNDAQSFRDLAYIYKETGEYTKSFALYKRILANQTPGVDFSGIQGVAEAELRELLANHKDKVYYKDLPNNLLQTDYKRDMRIVFEWNDPAAEFDIQFVDPSKKYFTYKHTRFDNLEQMEDEYTKGYSIEQFEIDDSVRGNWLINVESLAGEASINPVYLKYTIYTNYGKSNQTQETGMVNLSDLNQKVTIKQLRY
ncbi:hypothetical protein [Gilvibacter sp.]|uniref:hypothetical protein n=1 Tax=Gilvibacter sp. TaxID=2729997 RepID=UPI0025C63D55|nr:hypothetical protein [Gilvibacter sp.]NQX76222.1 hypothetical protein [Gilvibacter sp.]